MSDQLVESAVAQSSEIKEESEKLEVKKDLRDLADNILQFGEDLIEQNGLEKTPEKGNTASVFMKSTPDEVLQAWSGSKDARPVTRSAAALDKMLKGDPTALQFGVVFDGEASMPDLRKKGSFGSGEEFGTRFTQTMLEKLGFLGEGEQIGQPLPGSHQEFIVGKGTSQDQARLIIDNPDKPFVVLGQAARSRDGKYNLKEVTINHRSQKDLSTRMNLNRNLPPGF